MNPRQIDQIDPQTNKIIKTFPSISNAAQFIGSDKGNIWQALVGRRRTAGGFLWAYSQEPYKFSYAKYSGGFEPRKIKQIDKQSGEVIDVFVSISRAAQHVGVTDSLICNVLRKRYGQRTAGGYKWEYCEKEVSNED